jgi:DNA-binding CsgD family transcriptional regulator
VSPERVTRLVGRDSELAILAERAGQARSGSARLVVVRGPDGIGKTNLLREFIASGLTGYSTLLHTVCQPATTGSGYGAVRDLLRPLGLSSKGPADPLLSGHAGRSWPVISEPAVPDDYESPGEPGAYAVLHGLYWLAVNLMEPGPLALVVDDVHHCDERSLRWIEFLLHRSDDLPLLVVLAQGVSAEEPNARVLSEIAAHHSCTVADLGPLTRAEMADFVRRSLGAEPDESFVGDCAEVSAGNPRMLDVLLRELRRRGVRPDADAAGQVADAARQVVGASTLVRMVRRPDVRDVATAVAVMDCTDVELVGALARVPATQAAEALDVLRSSEILTADGTSMAHRAVRRQVLDDIPAHELEDLRSRAAGLLNDAGRPAEEVARQLLPLRRLDQAWMLDVLWDAAARAEGAGPAGPARPNGDPEMAVRYLRRALAAQTVASERTKIHVRLARLLSAIDPYTALSHFREAMARLTDPFDRGQTAVYFAITALATRRIPEAIRVLGEALDALRLDMDDNPPYAVTELCNVLQSTLLLIGIGMKPADSGLGERIQTVRHEFKTFAEPDGYTCAERRSLATLALLATLECRPAKEATRLAQRALADGGWGDWVANGTSLALSLADEVDASMKVYDWLLAETQARGDDWTRHVTMSTRAMTLNRLGRINEAADDARMAVEIAEQAPWRRDAALPFVVASSVLAAQDDIAGAEAMLDRVTVRVENMGWVWVAFYHEWARASARRGDIEGALNMLRNLGQSLDAADITNPVYSPWRSEAARLLARTARLSEARHLLDQEAELARRWGTPRAVGQTLTAAGMVATDPRQAVELLGEALDVLAEAPALTARIHASYQLGRAFLRIDDSSAARRHLRDAVNLSARSGARRLHSAASNLLISAGGRLRRATDNSLSGLLTESERRVATMAADGMSNREISETLFVTLRTVETHLTSAYRKLGVSRRSDLAAALTN